MRGKYLWAGVAVAVGSILLSYILHTIIPSIWPFDAFVGIFGLAGALLFVLVGLFYPPEES